MGKPRKQEVVMDSVNTEQNISEEVIQEEVTNEQVVEEQNIVDFLFENGQAHKSRL